MATTPDIVEAARVAFMLGQGTGDTPIYLRASPATIKAVEAIPREYRLEGPLRMWSLEVVPDTSLPFGMFVADCPFAVEPLLTGCG